jgi:hypothetical protein
MHQSVGLFWVPGQSEVRGNEISDELPTEGTVYHSAGPRLAVGVFDAEYKEKYKKLKGQTAYGNVISYDIFFNCNYADTQWQLYSTHLHTNNT